MPKRDLHKKPFDEGTKDKLNLYRNYFREWLQVFLNVSHTYIDTIQIFDFFAGPGIDKDGNPGSPIIACDEINNAFRQNERQFINKKIKVYFNEINLEKFNKLQMVIEQQKIFIPQVTFKVTQYEFCCAFQQWEPLMCGVGKKTANLLFLDQNGVQQITKSIFQTIIGLPRTDFIFFISSAMVNRFKDQHEIRKYVPVEDEDFLQMNGTNVHRILANAYRRWVPDEIAYYLGSFSIKKNSNVYGIVFGSGHPLGIEKFLCVAWKHGGDANFDIDNDGDIQNDPWLFPEFAKPKKIEEFEKDLETAVLERRVKTNKEVYIFSLQNGVLPKHGKAALMKMIKEGKLPNQTFRISYDSWKKPSCENIIFT